MNLTRRSFLASTAVTSLAWSTTPSDASTLRRDGKKLVLIAGTPSHPPGMHEHNAGVLLFQKLLGNLPNLNVQIALNGYPKDDSILDDADGIFVYADGGRGHPLTQGDRVNRIDRLLAKGVGLFCCHYGVDVVKEVAGDTFRQWIGGCYEYEWSCNAMWNAEFKELPKHSVTRGVEPFAIYDEWYFNMRFRPEMQGVTPLLTATPSDATRDGPYVYPKGPYKHIQEAKGRAEHLMWCTERADGGRGVGFTGGHFHKNWKDDNFRKIVLNAMLWICKYEVPEGGVQSTVTEEDLSKNLDDKTKKK